MARALKLVVQLIWTVCIVLLSTAIGAVHGWEHHGWIGGIALGLVGLCVGAFLASSPALVLQFLK